KSKDLVIFRAGKGSHRRESANAKRILVQRNSVRFPCNVPCRCLCWGTGIADWLWLNGDSRIDLGARGQRQRQRDVLAVSDQGQLDLIAGLALPEGALEVEAGAHGPVADAEDQVAAF